MQEDCTPASEVEGSRAQGFLYRLRIGGFVCTTGSGVGERDVVMTVWSSIVSCDPNVAMTFWFSRVSCDPNVAATFWFFRVSSAPISQQYL